MDPYPTRGLDPYGTSVKKGLDPDPACTLRLNIRQESRTRFVVRGSDSNPAILDGRIRISFFVWRADLDLGPPNARVCAPFTPQPNDFLPFTQNISSQSILKNS